MPIQYLQTDPVLRPGKLSANDLRAIGRLIRAFSELEDILTLFLFKITRVGNGAGRALLGHQPISKKTVIAQQFLEKGSKDFKNLKDTYLSERFSDVQRCRKVCAHGILLGVDQKGWFAFQTDGIDAVLGETMAMRVLHYPPSLIYKLSMDAEAMIAQFEQALGMQSSREKRYTPPLLAAPDPARAQVQKAGKRLPRSSPR